jgi:hypothetical protein
MFSHFFVCSMNESLKLFRATMKPKSGRRSNSWFSGCWGKVLSNNNQLLTKVERRKYLDGKILAQEAKGANPQQTFRKTMRPLRYDHLL